jgi:hypothetical protein
VGALADAWDVLEAAVLEGAGEEVVEFFGGGDCGHFDYVEHAHLCMILKICFF